MWKEIGEQNQFLNYPQRKWKKSSSLRPPSISPRGDLVSESLESIHDLSSSQIYPFSESDTYSGNPVPRINASVPPSAGRSSPRKYNTADSPICIPRNTRTMPTIDPPVERVLGSNLPPQANYVENQRDFMVKDLGSTVPRGSLDYFKKILPPLRPEFDFNMILFQLIKNGDLAQEKDIYVWKELRVVPTSTTLEKEIFDDPLINVFKAIRDAALKTSNIKADHTINMVTDGSKAPTGNQRMYDIEVGGEHYRMGESDMISGGKADVLVTSETRVWKVERDIGGPDVIIKDYWPGEAWDTDNNIREMILKDIRDLEKQQFFKEHTLTPIIVGQVKCKGEDDHMKDTVLRGHEPDTDETHKIPIGLSRSSHKSKGSISLRVMHNVAEELVDKTQPLSQELEQNQRKKSYHHHHYRIAYEEVGVPYYKIREIDDMLTVLIDALKGEFNVYLRIYVFLQKCKSIKISS